MKKNKIPEVLLISKPLSPPWNDSGKNFVRNIIKYSDGVCFHIFTSKGENFIKDGVINEVIYPHSSSYKLSFQDKMRVFLRLLKPDNIPIYHFFFAPNPMSSFFSQIAMSLKKNKITVQTLLSLPKNFEGIKNLIFSEYVLTVSEWAKRKLENEGVRNVYRISPGVEIFLLPSTEEKTKAKIELGFGSNSVILFAGDYEFGGGVEFVLKIAKAFLMEKTAIFVIACRKKTKDSEIIEKELKRKAIEYGIFENLHFLGEVKEMKKLFFATDIQIFPCESLYAKMDIPLVLLEGMSFGIPIIISDTPPLNEIMKGNNGFKIKSFDENLWAKTIINLISHKDYFSELRENSFNIVKNYFNCERFGKEYSEFYKSIY